MVPPFEPFPGAQTCEVGRFMLQSASDPNAVVQEDIGWRGWVFLAIEEQLLFSVASIQWPRLVWLRGSLTWHARCLARGRTARCWLCRITALCPQQSLGSVRTPPLFGDASTLLRPFGPSFWRLTLCSGGPALRDILTMRYSSTRTEFRILAFRWCILGVCRLTMRRHGVGFGVVPARWEPSASLGM